MGLEGLRPAKKPGGEDRSGRVRGGRERRDGCVGGMWSDEMQCRGGGVKEVTG
jgi:hypothetical protein